MRTPEFIYFDLGNVLLHFDHRRAARQMAAVASCSESLAWEVVFDRGLHWEYERGDLTTRQFYEAFCEATRTRPDEDALIHAAADIFELNVPIVPIVAALRSAGRRLGILSNTNEAHWQFVSQGRYAIIRDLFDVTALSFLMHALKPEPRAYELAAELAGVPASRIFFMDDRPENVLGALAAGFDAMLYENAVTLAEALRQRGVELAFSL